MFNAISLERFGDVGPFSDAYAALVPESYFEVARALLDVSCWPSGSGIDAVCMLSSMEFVPYFGLRIICMCAVKFALVSAPYKALSAVRNLVVRYRSTVRNRCGIPGLPVDGCFYVVNRAVFYRIPS